MGYILSDMTIIISNYRLIGDAFTLAHHCATLFGYAHSLVILVKTTMEAMTSRLNT